MAVKSPPETIVEIAHCVKTYDRPEKGGTFTVIEDVSFHVQKGEIVALLGRSGSGKSTLLRIIAGLIKPTKGNVYSGGKPVTSANPDVAMVFQSFALLPWLTVLENVELGLESRPVERKEGRKLAQDALKMVGLDGFDRAYPKELSGGMQQRVGFARAFVVRPRVLMLDEPFSALDVLTAENLRGEIADLWEAGNFPAESVIMVTHNIEEAIMLADRLVIMTSNPGKIRGELRVTLPRPRDRHSAQFRAMADHVYTIMTNPETKVAPISSRHTADGILHFPALPDARAGGVSGFLELVDEYGGPEDVAVISDRLRMEADDLLPILDAAVLLKFAEVHQGDVTVTKIGKAFISAAEIEGSRAVFRKQVLEFAPLVAAIYKTVHEANGEPVKEEEFLDILDENYSEEEARNQFSIALDWGRYADLFEYDSDEGVLRLTFEDLSTHEN